jgi:hypothetical protein
MHTPSQAVATAEHFARLKIPVTPNECDHYVAYYYGLNASGFSSAYSHQIQVPTKYRYPFSTTAPAGRLLFYGDREPGHITLSVGNGNEASTDIGANGFVSIVPIGTVPAKWGLPEMFQADAWYGSQGVEVIGVTQVPISVTAPTVDEIAQEIWVKTTVARSGTHISVLQEIANQGTAITAIQGAITSLAGQVLTSPVETTTELTPMQIDAIASAVFAKFQAAVATP